MYLDSAILVKLVVREPDSEFYADLVEGRRDSRSSELAITECRSAMIRKRREGQIDHRTHDQAWDRLNALWSGGGLLLHPVSRGILTEAGEAIERCSGTTPLRTLDAIHLSTCLVLRAFPLVTNDQVLRAAAGLLRIPLGPLPA
jgi:predicted nucleic acid-binding protein